LCQIVVEINFSDGTTLKHHGFTKTPLRAAYTQRLRESHSKIWGHGGSTFFVQRAYQSPHQTEEEEYGLEYPWKPKSTKKVHEEL